MPSYTGFATVSDLIQDTRRLLMTGAVEERNKLAGNVTGLQNTVSLTYDLGSIDRGAKLSVGLEDMYVWAKSSQVATVTRQEFGSILEDHVTGATVYVNPKFSNYEIYDAFNRELLSWSSPSNGLFQVQDYALDYNPLIQGYDFPYDIIDIYEVRYTTPGPSQDWTLSQDWEFTRHAGADFASDNALFIRDAYPNMAVVVKVKTGFNVLVGAMNTTIADSGIPESYYDILTLGAAWRLTAPREIRRNFDEVQGDTRRAGEVPAGAQLGGSRELARMRQQRINEEAARLSQLYPMRSRRYPFTVGGY